ncbi:hypothetical protein Vadar_003501 [Vaccinium darrowii]|uniref:Uncharacterized protein n=1 Tax=Vaccinium darrowii TaxID=229202 RepID=A0ACB7Z152_9ERIC|nr:hypothetical protein Vadar_003501 [Vaccinium darrowii]
MRMESFESIRVPRIRRAAGRLCGILQSINAAREACAAVQPQLETNCRCLPGFNFVNNESWTLGCERDYAAVSCDTTNGSKTIKFDMKELDSTEWENEAYTVSELPNKEDCEQSCLEYCHCEVAFYSEGSCHKQRLPLRYGKRSQTSSLVAFIKVPEEDLVLAPKEPRKS